MGRSTREKSERRDFKEWARQALRARAEGREPVAREGWKLQAGPRISDALGELLEPCTSAGMSLGEYRKAVALAVVAWNCALLPEGEWRGPAQQALARLPPKSQEDALAVVGSLRLRKLQRFPADRRIIKDVEVRKGNDTFQLTVACRRPRAD